MDAWLIWSIVVAAAILLLGFVCVLGARKRFVKARKKYSDRPTENGVFGEELAFAALEVYSLDDVSVASTPDKDLNAYSIKERTLIFSQDVLDSTSVYALSVIAHEVGHARQHQENSALLTLWYILSHIERATTFLVLPLFVVGFVLSFIPATSFAGAILLNLSTTFTLLAILNRVINLPNESNASKRGLEMLEQSEAMTKSELRGARKMLRAALGTYFLSFYERLFLNFYLIKHAGKHAVTKIKSRKTKG